MLKFYSMGDIKASPHHHVFFLYIKKNTVEYRNPRKWRSCIDVTGPLSPVSRLARFCNQPEVKLHVFVRLKRGEEKLIGNFFFRFSYENNMKIRSSKICHIHLKKKLIRPFGTPLIRPPSGRESVVVITGWSD